jgi:hypothetical protein
MKIPNYLHKLVEARRAANHPHQVQALRLECKDGKCGRCHTCKGTKQVAVAFTRRTP